MQYPNEKDTKENILDRLTVYNETVQRIDRNTIERYEKLSYFEREQILKWIELYIHEIPIINKIKKAGLKRLQISDYQSHEALVLIRHAMKQLRF